MQWILELRIYPHFIFQKFGATVASFACLLALPVYISDFAAQKSLLSALYEQHRYVVLYQPVQWISEQMTDNRIT